MTTAVLDKSGNIIDTINNGSGNLAVDREGDLYIADDISEMSNTIQVYAPPNYAEVMAITVSRSETVGTVAVDPKTDLVAVTTVSNPESGPAEIVFFEHGASKPCNVIRASSVAPQGDYAAFDASDVLFFVASDREGKPYLASISGGCAAKAMQVYSLPRMIQYPADIAFDLQNNLVLQDAIGSPVAGPLYTFAHPQNGKIGKELSKTILNPLDKSYTPALATMTSDGKHLWAIAYPVGPTNYMAEYNYPQGGAPIKSIQGIQQPITAAVFPNYVP